MMSAAESAFRVDQIDHVELFVPDRFAAAAWFQKVLGLQVVSEFEHWAKDPNGPLMLATASGGTKLALFTGQPRGNASTAGFQLVAFRVSRAGLERFLAQVADLPVYDEHRNAVHSLKIRDHGGALSVYFCDPYGHHFEITTYEAQR
jgi:catechol 2,3-dioxygenase-like lactoylglutathione lyase family enzyme